MRDWADRLIVRPLPAPSYVVLPLVWGLGVDRRLEVSRLARIDFEIVTATRLSRPSAAKVFKNPQLSPVHGPKIAVRG